MLYGEAIDLDAIVSGVKSFTACREQADGVAAATNRQEFRRAAGQRATGRRDVRANARSSPVNEPEFNGRCWACQAWGHTRRNCPVLARGVRQEADTGNGLAGEASSDPAFPATQH